MLVGNDSSSLRTGPAVTQSLMVTVHTRFTSKVAKVTVTLQ